MRGGDGDGQAESWLEREPLAFLLCWDACGGVAWVCGWDWVLRAVVRVVGGAGGVCYEHGGGLVED